MSSGRPLAGARLPHVNCPGVDSWHSGTAEMGVRPTGARQETGMHTRTGIWFGSALVAAIVALASACTTDMNVQPSQAAASSGSAACDACHPGDSQVLAGDLSRESGTGPAREPAEGSRPVLVDRQQGQRRTESRQLRWQGLRTRRRRNGRRDPLETAVPRQESATGHHQFLDKQWNSYTGVWEGYANKDDWEAGCATCHGDHGKAARITVDAPANDL